MRSCRFDAGPSARTGLRATYIGSTLLCLGALHAGRLKAVFDVARKDDTSQLGPKFCTAVISAALAQRASRHPSMRNGPVLLPAALAGVFTAGLVGATLLLLTPVFENMPLNALGAIVISGVIGLINCDEAVFLWRVSDLILLIGIQS